MENLSARDFRKDALQRTGSWVVNFTADWCPFCQAFLPAFRALEHRVGPRVAIGDVTDLESPLWEDFALEVVPTLVQFESGRPVRRLDGVLGEGLTPTRFGKFVAALPPAGSK